MAERAESAKPRRARSRAPESARSDASVPNIVAALVDEHKYQARLLTVMERQVGLLNQRKLPDYEVMHGVMRYMTQFPDRFHHPKEDLLFDKVLARDPASAESVAPGQDQGGSASELGVPSVKRKTHMSSAHRARFGHSASDAYRGEYAN